MITINIFRVLQLLAYFLITIQLTYYLYLMSDALKQISIDNFYEQRKAVHELVGKRHQPVYYLTLLLSLITVIMTVKQPSSVLFICSTIALVCLIADIVIAMKGNGPINEVAKTYVAGAAGNWEAMRLQWLKFVNIRGVISTIGFLSLLTSWILQKK